MLLNSLLGNIAAWNFVVFSSFFKDNIRWQGKLSSVILAQFLTIGLDHLCFYSKQYWDIYSWTIQCLCLSSDEEMQWIYFRLGLFHTGMSINHLVVIIWDKLSIYTSSQPWCHCFHQLWLFFFKKNMWETPVPYFAVLVGKQALLNQETTFLSSLPVFA